MPSDAMRCGTNEKPNKSVNKYKINLMKIVLKVHLIWIKSFLVGWRLVRTGTGTRTQTQILQSPYLSLYGLIRSDLMGVGTWKFAPALLYDDWHWHASLSPVIGFLSSQIPDSVLSPSYEFTCLLSVNKLNYMKTLQQLFPASCCIIHYHWTEALRCAESEARHQQQKQQLCGNFDNSQVWKFVRKLN